MRYMDSWFRLEQRRWDARRLDLSPLSVRETNFQPYCVRVPAAETELAARIRKLIEEKERVFRAAVQELPNLYFDRHIYQPLLLDTVENAAISPQGLNRGERQFVEDLRDYCERERDRALKGAKLFLLRNLAKGKGVGFFESTGFYPDFILWIKRGKTQRVVFVEPHGMVHDAAPQRNEKAGLHRKLRAEAAPALAKHKGVALDAYVVSRTPYPKLRDKWVHDGGASWTLQECADEHILFPMRTDEYDYIERLLDPGAAG